ncbi:MAG: hypothetical protein WC546_04365 [Candidatus Omnitrophota bacterium]
MRLNLVCLLAIILCFSLCIVCAAQENLTITTYYPSPNGVYSTLQVLDAAGRGVMLRIQGGNELDIQGVNMSNTTVAIVNSDGSHGTLVAGRILICP